MVQRQRIFWSAIKKSSSKNDGQNFGLSCDYNAYGVATLSQSCSVNGQVTMLRTDDELEQSGWSIGQWPEISKVNGQTTEKRWIKLWTVVVAMTKADRVTHH